MEVQTRSDNHNGLYAGLRFFDSVRTAHSAWVTDNSIWKISWDEKRFVCKIFCNKSSELEEARLCTLSADYANCSDPNKIFWINEPMELVSVYTCLKTQLRLLKDADYLSIDEIESRKRKINDEIQLKFPDGFCRENAIIEVLTDEQFQKKYCHTE